LDSGNQSGLGLNAIGGAIALTMKKRHSAYQGREASCAAASSAGAPAPSRPAPPPPRPAGRILGYVTATRSTTTAGATARHRALRRVMPPRSAPPTRQTSMSATGRRRTSRAPRRATPIELLADRWQTVSPRAGTPKRARRLGSAK